MNLVVADHHHDADVGVYRLVIGEVIEHEQTVVDETGAIELDENDQPVTETVSEIMPVEDIVFADDDKRWRNKTPETIAAAQRQLVADALAERETEDSPLPAAATVQLPGVGESLGET